MADECRFLDGHKCGIYDARPAQCSTWPFWTDNLQQEVWNEKVIPFCAGAGQGRLYSQEEIEEMAARVAETD